MTYQRHSFTPDAIERLLHHMPAVTANAENTWAKGFAQSVVKQSRRKGWKPTAKQLSVMQGLVADLFAYGSDDGEEFNPIES
jgi:phage gp16-like protein